MKRPSWANGPLFDLKPQYRWAWFWLMLMAVGCTLALVVRGDLWLLMAMAPGVFIGVTAHMFSDSRYKQEVEA